jgi:hypothetical protein
MIHQREWSTAKHYNVSLRKSIVPGGNSYIVLTPAPLTRLRDTHLVHLPAYLRYGANRCVSTALSHALAHTRPLWFISGIYGIVGQNDPVGVVERNVVDPVRVGNLLAAFGVTEIWYVSDFNRLSDPYDKAIREAVEYVNAWSWECLIECEEINLFEYAASTLDNAHADTANVDTDTSHKP